MTLFARFLLVPALIATAFLSFAPASLRAAPAKQPEFDVVVYGGTSAGVTAAVAAGRAGQKVVLLESSYIVGGLMSGGLTKTDIGKPETIGGMAREFYDRVLAHYTKTYGADSSQVKESAGGYFFEPSLALTIFNDMLREAGVTVRLRERLEGVEVRGGTVVSITTRNYATDEVTTQSGRFFIDGTYEGDLLAQAGVLYRVGREARSEYGESLAGITKGPEEYLGAGDHRVQAYNIRGTLTVRDDLRVPIPKPKNYYREAHVGHIRTIKQHNLTTMDGLFTDTARWAMLNGKCDPNKADFPGVNFGYVEGDYEQRARITAKVQDYWLSLWYMLQNDPEIPEAFRADARRWGLPKDEYLESGHVTPQIYVRVGRRMMGRYWLTQNDLLYDRYKPDSVCLGSYNMDSHEIQMIQTDAGPVGEGHFNASADSYEIPYRSLLPHGVKNLVVVAAVSATHVAYSSLRMEPVFMMLGQAGGVAANLALADKVDAKDVSVEKLQSVLKAGGTPLAASFRPVVEIRRKGKGQPEAGKPLEFELVEKHVRSPLTVIAWNFDGSGEVQGTGKTASYTFKEPTKAVVTVLVRDQDKLVALPARLELDLGESASADLEVHYTKAKLTGRWDRTRGSDIEYRARVGLMDDKAGDGRMKAEFTATPTRSGRYRVAVAFPTAGNRSTKVPVTVTHAGGTASVVINQKAKGTPYAFMPVGDFRFEAGQPSSVTISNQGADGFVTIDAVRWIWLGE